MAVLLKVASTVSEAWSWCWGIGNAGDEESLTVVIVAAMFAVFWLVWVWKSNNGGRHPSMPPGPRALPLVGNLLSLDPELHSHFATLAKTYGPILTIWLGKKASIVVSSPAVAREVLRNHDTTFANRDVTVAGKGFSYGGNNIVWSPYGEQWRMLRKICVRQMLSSETLDSVYSLRRKEIRNTIKYLYSHVGSPVNIGEQMFLTFMNVITRMLWGGTVQAEDRVSMGVEFRQVSNEITGLLGMPNLSDFYPGLAWFDLQGIGKKMKVAVKKFDRIFERMIDQRSKMGGNQENNDFLQFLLQLKDDDGNSTTPFTMTHLKALLLDMAIGGTDTTSTSIEFALAHMMNKPETLKKARQELDTVVGKNNVVEESHTRNLPYLNAIMKEVLRLHPMLPLLVPHCPSQSCAVGGYMVPKGARVFVNAWAIHRDPAIWVNPSDFCPERFLDSNFDFSGNDFNYFPFGSGRRICPGTAMAERLFMYALASLLHSFDWKLGEGEKIELSEKFGIVLRKKEPLIAIPTPRLSGSSLYE